MRRLWFAFAAVMILSFAVLGWTGVRIYQEKPPIPERVVTTDGQEVIPPGNISAGQNVWQSLGGMELGSIWGHGSYVAPDWTADWLHREAVFILDEWAGQATSPLPQEVELGRTFAGAGRELRGALQGRLQALVRENRWDPKSGVLTIEPVRARAFASNAAHYADVFTSGRSAYAIPKGALTDPDRLQKLAAFFFWSSWAAATNRPGDTITYTSNWPHEPLVGNRPAGAAVVWTGVSIIVLLAGIGAMAFWYATQKVEPLSGDIPRDDPLLGSEATPSQRAVTKYFLTVTALILVQVPDGSRHRALRSGGQRLLRRPAGPVPAVLDHAHVARAARDLLDRDRLARGRALHRSRGRHRAAVSRGSASTCSSSHCWWSSSARWRASGSA